MQNQNHDVLKLFLGLFFTYHAVAMLAVNLPKEAALTQMVIRPFRRYVIASGNWQGWYMFVTVPYITSFECRLKFATGDGKTYVMGPLLPGLRHYDSYERNETWFHDIVDPASGYSGYLIPYLHHACDEFRRIRHLEPKTVSLMNRQWVVRDLAVIRATGQISDLKPSDFGPYPCN